MSYTESHQRKNSADISSRALEIKLPQRATQSDRKKQDARLAFIKRQSGWRALKMQKPTQSVGAHTRGQPRCFPSSPSLPRPAVNLSHHSEQDVLTELHRRLDALFSIKSLQCCLLVFAELVLVVTRLGLALGHKLRTTIGNSHALAAHAPQIAWTLDLTGCSDVGVFELCQPR